VDPIPPQRQDLALPHRRGPGECQERAHLTVTLRLVPQRPEFRRRHDTVATLRLGSLPNRSDRVLVEPAALHREVEDVIHDCAVMIHYGTAYR
jgi:hypothetical protein